MTEVSPTDTPRGFAGINTFESNIEDTLFEALRIGNSDTATSSLPSSPAKAEHAVSNPEPWCPQAPARKSREKLYWSILGCLIVLVYVVLAAADYMAQNKEEPAPSPISRTPASAEIDEPKRPIESVPPSAEGLMLNRAQITYCLAEGMRIDGAKGMVDETSQGDIDYFNAKIKVFNARCGSFQYRESQLESVKADLAPWHKQLTAEGEYMFLADRLPSKRH